MTSEYHWPLSSLQNSIKALSHKHIDLAERKDALDRFLLLIFKTSRLMKMSSVKQCMMLEGGCWMDLNGCTTRLR